MSRRIGLTSVLSFVSLAALVALSACQSQAGTASIETDDQKASYGIGLQMGAQLTPAGTHLDIDAFVAGIRDGKEGNEPSVPQEEIQLALQALNAAVMEEESQRMTAEAEANAADGEAFLAENATKDGITVTESGLQYEVISEGDGANPGPEDEVSINYRGTLLDGTQFDSSYDRGQPASFGVGGVIPGFSEGLQLMTVGSHYRFFIPSELGYGPSGAGGTIGPNATLIFEVELLEIVK
jgi:FKBP-type peptidyl-prolyl cis-trans isomerase FkpA/FKBP-type peptidyl-prolyl cis-trans isomerase FklB